MARDVPADRVFVRLRGRSDYLLAGALILGAAVHQRRSSGASQRAEVLLRAGLRIWDRYRRLGRDAQIAALRRRRVVGDAEDLQRSEERRGGKECRSRWAPAYY